jgi:hypothetical protein
MVAIITTDPPDTVVFNYWDVIWARQLPLTVIWDTGEPTVNAHIVGSVNGASPTPLAGAPQKSKSFRVADKISFGGRKRQTNGVRPRVHADPEDEIEVRVVRKAASGSILGAVGLGPEFAPPGSDGDETDGGSFAQVTDHFDTDEIKSGQERAFILATGKFSIAYDVFGSIKVVRRPAAATCAYRGAPGLATTGQPTEC